MEFEYKCQERQLVIPSLVLCHTLARDHEAEARSYCLFDWRPQRGKERRKEGRREEVKEGERKGGREEERKEGRMDGYSCYNDACVFFKLRSHFDQKLPKSSFSEVILFFSVPSAGPQQQ
jgi:hypothetical protein